MQCSQKCARWCLQGGGNSSLLVRSTQLHKSGCTTYCKLILQLKVQRLALHKQRAGSRFAHLGARMAQSSQFRARQGHQTPVKYSFKVWKLHGSKFVPIFDVVDVLTGDPSGQIGFNWSQLIGLTSGTSLDNSVVALFWYRIWISCFLNNLSLDPI